MYITKTYMDKYIVIQYICIVVFWTVIAVIITVTNGINAFSDKRIPTEEIYVESDEYNNRNIHQK